MRRGEPTGMHFERRAAVYGDARPPYPQDLWDWLRDRGVLVAGHRALDLGAGTGHATGPLLAAGLRVTAVEPGRRLAAQLARRFPDAQLVVDYAENLAAGAAAFDLAVAATSVHWFDLDAVLPKVRDALAPGGRFVVLRNVYGNPAAATPFREAVARIVRDRAGRRTRDRDWESVAETAAAVTARGVFAVADSAAFDWQVDLTERQVRNLFSTFSDWDDGEVERAARAVADLGGTVTEHYSSWALCLRPVGAR